MTADPEHYEKQLGFNDLAFCPHDHCMRRVANLRFTIEAGRETDLFGDGLIVMKEPDRISSWRLDPCGHWVIAVRWVETTVEGEGEGGERFYIKCRVFVFGVDCDD